jgi:WD40 repeat protein
MGIAPDGRIALATDLFGGFSVIDVVARRVLWTQAGRQERRDYAECVAISPDCSRAIIGMSNGRVELWDLERRRRRRSFRLHADRAGAVTISPDGALGCSAGWDRVLRVWKLETGDVVASFSSDDAWSACVFAGASRIVASDDRGLHFLELENAEPNIEHRSRVT